MADVNQIISLMAKLAPGKYSCDWDNCGIQTGDFNQEVKRVLITLDILPAVLDEALKKGCEMIISHHPLIFNGLKSIHNQTQTGKVVMKAIKNNIVLYSAHTNLDIAPGGLNDYLAGLLEIEDIEPLQVSEKESYYKLVVFIPVESAEAVKEAILDNGGGYKGKYSHTSFSTGGEGTFKPLEGSNPYSGKTGEISRVKEIRFETIVPEDKIDKVVRAMLKAHPYEEVAYDIYPLINNKVEYGVGRTGNLKEEIKYTDFIEIIKNELNIEVIRYTGNPENKIKKVALCTGSGSDLIRDAARNGADLFITGDVKLHEAQLADELGLNLIDAGHFETEIIVKDLLFDFLTGESLDAKLDIEFFKSEYDMNPWKFKF